MNQKKMIHNLRNPFPIFEDEMRATRLQAANEIERLQSLIDIINGVKPICPECSINPCACELHG